MRVIVVHEDGDRTSRVETLAEEVRICIETGSMRVIGVNLEVRLPQSTTDDYVYKTMSDEFPVIHGDVGHSCYNEDGTVTCVVAKMLISGLGPSWRQLLAAANINLT